jgi:hypothetical protein
MLHLLIRPSFRRNPWLPQLLLPPLLQMLLLLLSEDVPSSAIHAQGSNSEPGARCSILAEVTEELKNLT